MRLRAAAISLLAATFAVTACSTTTGSSSRALRVSGVFTPADASASPGGPLIPAFATLSGVVTAPAQLVAAGGGNILAAGASGIIAAAGGMVAAGGGNMVAAGGGNVVGQNGMGVVGQNGSGVVGQNGMGIVGQNGSGMVAAGGGNMVAAGGGNLVQFGAHMVAAGGGNMVAAGGGNMVAAGGGNMVAAGGGNMVAAGGGNYRAASRQATPRSSYQLAELQMQAIPSEPVVGARVLLHDLQGQPIPIPETYTDAAGHYQIPQVPGGKQYVVTAVVGDESAALTTRYRLAGTRTFADLENPLVIGIALPGQPGGASPTASPAATPAASGTPTTRPATPRPTGGPDRSDLFLKTFAASDRPLVQADITLATTVLLEALVLSGARREAITPEAWADVVERVTPLLREIAPAGLPEALLAAPIVDAAEDPERAREVLTGWSLIRPDLTTTFTEIVEDLGLGPAAPTPTPAAAGGEDVASTPGPGGSSSPDPAPSTTPDAGGGGSGGAGSGGSTDGGTSTGTGTATVTLTPGGWATPTASPAITIGGGR